MPFDEEGEWEDFTDEEFIESPQELSEMGKWFQAYGGVSDGQFMANYLYMCGLETAALNLADAVDGVIDFYETNGESIFGKEIYYDESVLRWRELETGLFFREPHANLKDWTEWL